MKNTLTKEEKDFLGQIIKITEKILEIYTKLSIIDIKKEKNKKEYQQLLTNLKICLDLEQDLFQELDIKTIEHYLLFISPNDLFSYLNDYHIVLNFFDNLLCFKRIYNRLENMHSKLIIQEYQKHGDEKKKEHKIFIMDAIDLDIKNLLLFLINSIIKEMDEKRISIGFKRAKYFLIFLNSDLEKKNTPFLREEKVYLTSKSLSDLLGVSEDTYYELLFLYYKKEIELFVQLIEKKKENLEDDYKTLIQEILYRLLTKSILILNEGNKEIKEEIHAIIKEENTPVVSFLNDTEKEKIMILRSERLVLFDGSSK